MKDKIQLLQFFICKNFQQEKQDCYTAGMLHTNLYVSKFPHRLGRLYAITCWRKDARFHKEVIEYVTGEGKNVRSPHMDVEPVSGSVLFRWHKHPFPAGLIIEKPTTLTVRIILDGKIQFESCLLIEKA